MHEREKPKIRAELEAVSLKDLQRLTRFIEEMFEPYG